jgi:hypothetical protein
MIQMTREQDCLWETPEVEEEVRRFVSQLKRQSRKESNPFQKLARTI